MTLYTVNAVRETHYEFEIEAENEDEAIAKVQEIELTEDVEAYAYDWYPLEITEVEEYE